MTCREFDLTPDTAGGRWPVVERSAFTVFPQNLRLRLSPATR